MKALRELEDSLKGWPDELLTVSLLTAALLLVCIALRGPTSGKALALAYVIFP